MAKLDRFVSGKIGVARSGADAIETAAAQAAEKLAEARAIARHADRDDHAATRAIRNGLAEAIAHLAHVKAVIDDNIETAHEALAALNKDLEV